MTHWTQAIGAECIAAVQGLQLDEMSRSPFDAICHLAREHFSVSMAVISLIDAKGFVFHGRCGIALTNIPHDVAFSTHAAASDDLFLVEDAASDPRFCANPLVTGEPHIRFFACAPILDRHGLRLGGLCLLDNRPRGLSEGDRTSLWHFATLAAESLQHRAEALAGKAKDMALDLQQAVLAQTEDIALVGLWEWRPLIDQLTWSDGQYRLLGLEPGSVQPSIDRFLAAVHPEDRATCAVACEATRTERRMLELRYRVVRPDGEVRLLTSRGEIIADDAGPGFRAVGITHDITDREAAGAALRSNEARWRQALQAGKMIAFDIDLTTGFATLSDHADQLTGLGSRHYLDFVALVHADDRDEVRAALERAMWHGTPYAMEFRFIRPDGVSRWLSQAAAVTTPEPGLPQRLAGVCFDITDRKMLEMQLQQAWKMEAIGQLTGGIAHDFNNLLTIILGHAELLAESARYQPEIRTAARVILNASERGADLTQRLLSFGRRQILKPEAVEPAGLIARVADLLDRTLGDHIMLRTEIAPDAPAAFVDRTILETVLVNLALNARDAMPNGGTLSISAKAGTAEPDQTARLDIEVIDSGQGMAPDVLARVFEPFFTTKPVGRGSGLGLSMVYGFVKQSGGYMAIDSEPGRGTTVLLQLPAVLTATAMVEQAPPPSSLPGRGRVLVVEDEADLRSSVVSQLTSLGYSPVEAADGPTALARIHADPAIDLVFTDLVMPNGMDGVQLADRIATLRPGLPVLFTSGYAEDVLKNSERRKRGVNVLRKPYRRGELAAAIQKALAEASMRPVI